MKIQWSELIFFAAVIFVAAFLASSNLLFTLSEYVPDVIKKTLDAIDEKIQNRLLAHITVFSVFEDKPKYYFILPTEIHSKSYAREKISHKTIFPVLVNAFFNSVFQPLFPCVFTPQVILTYALFPFFLFGCIRYFRVVPIMIIFFICYSVYIGLRHPVVEALIRHRLSCELIYISISLAGFFHLIERKSS